jgi:hypothetical protein
VGRVGLGDSHQEYETQCCAQEVASMETFVSVRLEGWNGLFWCLSMESCQGLLCMFHSLHLQQQWMADITTNLGDLSICRGTTVCNRVCLGLVQACGADKVCLLVLFTTMLYTVFCMFLLFVWTFIRRRLGGEWRLYDPVVIVE